MTVAIITGIPQNYGYSIKKVFLSLFPFWHFRFLRVVDTFYGSGRSIENVFVRFGYCKSNSQSTTPLLITICDINSRNCGISKDGLQADHPKS